MNEQEREEAGESAQWQGEARSNWLWLVPLPSRAIAVELAAPGSQLPGALTRWFDRVDRLPLHPFDGFSFADSTVSCVVVHNPQAPLESHDRSHLLAECVRVIEPGGWLYIGRRNPSWMGALRQNLRKSLLAITLETMISESSRLTPVRSLRTAALAAGFSEVRRYLVSPSLEAPYSLVPSTRGAVIGHSRFLRGAIGRRRLRNAMAAVGCYAPLYPVEILLCRK